MNATLKFLIDHGYVVIFLGVLAEQIGLPMPSAPILLAAGALVGLGRLDLFMVLSLALSASLIADLIWFFLGKLRGSALLAFLCRVALEPDTCISKTHSAYTRYGARSLLFSKFVPGLNTLAPPMSGMYGLAWWKFILLDGAGALIWSGAFVAAGFVFRMQLEDIAFLLERLGSGLGAFLVLALAVYIASKYIRRRKIYHALRSVRITPVELKKLVDEGSIPTIVDLRADFERKNGTIPGAIALRYDDVDSLPGSITDREIILYCSCPNEVTSVRAALRLRRRGATKVRPLEGGFEGWRSLGYPVEMPSERAARAAN
jgi:membrane protein DedA with SNARE-associated domain/rhodanese-related sulfurtransferase